MNVPQVGGPTGWVTSKVKPQAAAGQSLPTEVVTLAGGAAAKADYVSPLAAVRRWAEGQLEAAQGLAGCPPLTPDFPERKEDLEAFDRGARQLHTRCEWVRHNGTNFVTYRVGSEPGLPGEVKPALEAVGRMGGTRTSMCFDRSNDLVLDGQAQELLAIRAGSDNNIRGAVGVHYVAGIPLPDGAYAVIDPTWPVSTEEERARGWPQGVLVLADSRAEAMKAVHQLYGAPPEAEPPEVRWKTH